MQRHALPGWCASPPFALLVSMTTGRGHELFTTWPTPLVRVVANLKLVPSRCSVLSGSWQPTLPADKGTWLRPAPGAPSCGVAACLGPSPARSPPAECACASTRASLRGCPWRNYLALARLLPGPSKMDPGSPASFESRRAGNMFSGAPAVFARLLPAPSVGSPGATSPVRAALGVRPQTAWDAARRVLLAPWGCGPRALP